MTEFDLGNILKEYRLQHSLSMKQMAKKLDNSTSSYERLENKKRDPTLKEVIRFNKILDLKIAIATIKTTPEPPRKWYRSKMWRWAVPVFVSYVIVSVMMEMRGFRAGYGEQEMNDNTLVALMIITCIVFCVVYWYYYPPPWPNWKNLKKLWKNPKKKDQ